MEFHCCILFVWRGWLSRVVLLDLLPSINDTNYCLGRRVVALFLSSSSTVKIRIFRLKTGRAEFLGEFLILFGGDGFGEGFQSDRISRVIGRSLRYWRNQPFLYF